MQQVHIKCIITVTSHVSHGLLNHRRLDCLLNILVRLALVLCEESRPVTGGFPSQRANNAECGLCHGIKPSVWCILQWRHNERDGVSNHQGLDRLLTSKLRVTGFCEGNPLVTYGFPIKRASNTEMFPFDDVIMVLPVPNALVMSPYCSYII